MSIGSSESALEEMWARSTGDIGYAEILIEMKAMSAEGLLEVGVNEMGDMIFWPTPKGCEVLGMEAVPA